MTAKKTQTWGGRREGAGRKRMVQDPVRLSLDVERADISALKEISNRKGVSLAELVRETLKRRIGRQR